MLIVNLRTPEQVAEDLGHISPHTIRRLVRDKLIGCTKLARGKLAFTDEQVDAMLKYLEVPPAKTVARLPSDLGPTARSAAIRRSRANRSHEMPEDA